MVLTLVHYYWECNKCVQSGKILNIFKFLLLCLNGFVKLGFAEL
jgi:hypothetical protein